MSLVGLLRGPHSPVSQNGESHCLWHDQVCPSPILLSPSSALVLRPILRQDSPGAGSEGRGQSLG